MACAPRITNRNIQLNDVVNERRSTGDTARRSVPTAQSYRRRAQSYNSAVLSLQVPIVTHDAFFLGGLTRQLVTLVAGWQFDHVQLGAA